MLPIRTAYSGESTLTCMATILCLLHDIALIALNLVLTEPGFCKTMQAAAV